MPLYQNFPSDGDLEFDMLCLISTWEDQQSIVSVFYGSWVMEHSYHVIREGILEVVLWWNNFPHTDTFWDIGGISIF